MPALDHVRQLGDNALLLVNQTAQALWLFVDFAVEMGIVNHGIPLSVGSSVPESKIAPACGFGYCLPNAVTVRNIAAVFRRPAIPLLALAVLFVLAAAVQFAFAQEPDEIYLPYVTSDPDDPPDPGHPFATQVVALVNQERAEHGCQPLQVDSRLVNAAVAHSQDMALNDFFDHVGSDNSLPWDRIVAEGYNYSWAGENIAAGHQTPEHVVAEWMDSPGHRANILNCAFTETGVGYIYMEQDQGTVNYRHYWTHVFATPG